ncbi:MAG: hypothetical protein HC879_00795 [Leptolyngbyaceae cyanobacterium SL_5_9]|nr:hypothetical protein [Leptolyngbyaceae cyanobacterium SL_5_9]NJO73105.1 hypothetical protein [Leptolyngbyaceae cyanobacterium RM1_406_9]
MRDEVKFRLEAALASQSCPNLSHYRYISSLEGGDRVSLFQRTPGAMAYRRDEG